MTTSEETSGRRVVWSTAIAGLLGTLVGTVVGGLISLAAVEQNIRAGEASNLRSNRQEAYSVFLADVSRHAQLISVGLADGTINSAEKSKLGESNLELARSHASAYIVASDEVSDALIEVQSAYGEYEKAALETGRIDDIEDRVYEALNDFVDAARRDLGAVS